MSVALVHAVELGERVPPRGGEAVVFAVAVDAAVYDGESEPAPVGLGEADAPLDVETVTLRVSIPVGDSCGVGDARIEGVHRPVTDNERVSDADAV